MSRLKLSFRKKVLKNLEHGGHEIKKEKKYSINYIVIAFVLIIVVIGILLLIEYGPLFGIRLLGNNKQNVILTEIVESTTKFVRYNKEILTYDNTYLRTYNAKGDLTWEHKLDSNFNPTIYIKENFMAVANVSQGNIYFFEGKNEILNQKIEGTISNIYLDGKGNMAIEYSKSGYKKAIDVRNKEGKSVYTVNINNDTILDIKMLDNAQKLIILQTISNAMSIGTGISLVDSTKENAINQIAVLDGKLVFASEMIDQELVILTESSIERLNLENNQTKTIHNLTTTQTNFASLSYNYFVTIESSSNTYLYSTRKVDGTSIAQIQIAHLPKYIKTDGLLTYIVFEDNIMIVNKWGILVEEIKINMSPKDVIIFNGSKSAALIYSNRIEIINL